jgi:hypothetical protein
MKYTNPKCGGEWTPPAGKSITVCPFCGEPVAAEKKMVQSFDNVIGTLTYIKDTYGVDALLGKKVYTFFDDLTLNQLRDEKDLTKTLCEKGALDCLKAAIGQPDTEHGKAIKRAIARLPKYLQDAPAVAEMLRNFAEVLGWKLPEAQVAPTPPQPVIQQPQQPTIVQTIDRADTTGGTVSTRSTWPALDKIYRFGNIDWSVLDVDRQKGKALLISNKIIEKRPYNVEYANITWESCTLRKYLNGEFLNKLGAAESAIAETRNSNPNNPWYGTAGGNTTTDKVFLLSLDELVKYFGDSGDLANKRRKDYKGNSDLNGYYVHDRYNNARIANYGSEGACWWWLRSPGLRW